MNHNNKFINKINMDKYYAVIFSSKRNNGDNEYNAMGEKMIDMASKQSGFLGLESVRDSGGNGITVSYWDSLQNIDKWKNNVDHLIAQKIGRDKWYSEYAVKISMVISV